MEKQVTFFAISQKCQSKEERASETFRTLVTIIKKLTWKLKALRVFVNKLSNGAPNYEFKFRIKEILQCILTSSNNEY